MSISIQTLDTRYLIFACEIPANLPDNPRCGLSGCVANFGQEAVKGQLPLSVEELSGQCVEQFGRSAALFSGLYPHLSFLDHGHELNPNEGVLGCLERFKP
jgi:hypothetical protein